MTTVSRPVGLMRGNRNFRYLWYAETAGKFGGSVITVMLPLIALSELHLGPFEVGLVNASAWLPWLVIGLPAGVWVDRLRRRPVMQTADAVCFFLFATVPLMAWSGALSFAQLLVVAMLTGGASVFFQTAYTAYLPSIVAVDQQAEGNAKLHGSAAVAQVAGYGLGGVFAQLFGAANGIIATMVTFVVSFVCLTRIQHREPLPDVTHRPSAWKDIGSGLRFLYRDAYLRVLTLFGALSNLVMTGFQSMLVVFLVQDVGLNSGQTGALASAGGVGALLGAFMARHVTRRIGSARALLLFASAVPALAVLVPLTTKGAGLLLYIIGFGAVALGVVSGNVIRATFIQQYCPPAMLGRITASSAFHAYGTLPLGALLGGALGATFGVGTAIWVLALGMPLSSVILYFSPLRTRRDLPPAPNARRCLGSPPSALGAT